MKDAGLLSDRWRSFAIVFVLVLSFSFLNTASLSAQGTAGKILGTVTDQSGGAIAGATVIVTDVDRNVSRTLTTDQGGEYSAPNLLPGAYKVRAEAKGFKAFERSGVVLQVNGEIRVDLTMQPGEVSQTITVNEAVPLVETTNAELGATLQSAIIEDIPLNGRNFENLLQLNPGVTIYPGGAGFTQSANGQRPHDNAYMVNGIMASDPWMGQSVFNAVMAAGDAGTIMPVDAIDEFKTEENPRAEFGWKPGAIVNVGVKSGTNSLHGSAYAYGRDTAFDARNYFNPTNGVNPTKQQVALEQFGGTMGGAIKKDKLFYFANFERQHYDIGAPNSVNTPQTVAGAGPGKSLIDACNAALGAGKLTALSTSLAGLDASCNPISSKLTTDPGGLQFQGLFPVDTTGAVGTDLINNSSVNGGLVKVNYHASDKHQLEAMYFISEGNTSSVDSPVSETSTNWITAQHARSQAISGDWAYTPNANLVNEVRVGYAHYYQTFFSTDAGQNAANYNFNGQTYEIPTGITNPIYGGFPRLRLKGFNAYPAGDAMGAGWPKIVGPDGVLEMLDHVSLLRGKHSFKFGGEFIYNASSNNVTANAKSQLRFASLTNFFEGDFTKGKAFLFTGNAQRHLYNNNFAGFLQDDWRITPRLTLNLGVRYELSTVVHERDGLMANFDPILGMVQTNSPYHGDHNNFSPRVGFAWDVFGTGKTVIRGGAGILYEQVSFDVFNGEGNLLGLRTFPTGVPLYNAGSNTALPISGNIDTLALTLTGAALGPIGTAWQNFNPAAPVAGQTTLFSAVANPACGDGINNPNPSLYQTAPAPCELYGVNPNIRTPYVNNWNLDIQHAITNNLSIDIGYVGNHGTKLLGKLNHNQPLFGTGWNVPLTATAVANDGYCVTIDILNNCTQSDVGVTPAQVCAGGGGEAIYSLCSPSASLEQAGQPFTAPCASAVGVGPNGSGGIFNTHNSCLSYVNYVTLIDNIYNANYNGLQVTLTGRNYHGLSFTAGYTFSHALGMASDQGTAANFPAPLDSYGSLRQQLYANTDFDIRHRFTVSLNYALPGRKGFGQLMEGWTLNTVVVVTSGLPWGLADQSDDFSGTNGIGTSSADSVGEQWNFYGNSKDFTPVHGWTDTNGGWQSGGGGLPFFAGTGDPAAPTGNAACDAKAIAGGPLEIASTMTLGCYAVGNSVMIPAAFGSAGNTKPNIFRDAGFKNVDFSIAKAFTIKERLKAEARVEFFNIFNHPNFSNPSGGPGGGVQDPSAQPFGFVGLTPDTYSSNPQLGSGGERAMQLGLKLSW